MAYITIVKGDDTDFLDNQYLVVKFNTEIELAGFQAIFKLGNIELLYPDLSAKYIEIVLSKEVTSALQKGKMYGTLKLVDTENRTRTVTTVLPFNVVTKVMNTSQISQQSIQLEVKVEQNEISVDMNILGLSKTVAESYLTQMKQNNAQMTEKVQSMMQIESDIEQMRDDVVNSHSMAEQWAVADGLVNDTDYSAKYYANQAVNSAKDAKLTLSNTLNKSQLTNCLLEVPQRINLELTDSGLTLKAGSVVIVPNGTDGFKEVVISADLTRALTYFTGSEQFMLFYNETENGALAGRRLTSQVASGATTPTTGHWHYYNTTDNYVYVITDDELRDYKASFPLGLITVTDGTITSIDQVFNGMGYIGSTVWVDRGVKGLIPNGRNEDGTLKNIEFTLPNILVSSLTGSTRDMVAIIYNGGTSYSLYRGFYKDYKYNAEANVNMNLQTHPKWDMVPIGYTLGDITKLVVKQPVSLFDPNNVMSTPIELYGASGHLGLFGGSIFTHNMNYSMGTAPSSNIYEIVLQHEDKDNVRKGRLESFYKTDGSHGFQITEANNGNYSAICAGFDANGDAYTYAPHCNVANGIVTQVAFSKAGNGYMKFGNGLIIQWGRSDATTATKVTTLPTAFTSANYRVVAQHEYLNGDAHHNITITAYTTTSFTMWSNSTTANAKFHWIAIGY